MTSNRTQRLVFAATVLLGTIGAVRVTFARDEQLIDEARQTVASYRRADPGLERFFQRAAGYAVFPGVGKGGYVVGGAHGTGVVFEHGAAVGMVTMNQVTGGPLVGGQEDSVIICFETPEAISD